MTHINPSNTATNTVMEEHMLTIDWADGQQSQFHYIWLRDNCPQSCDPNNGQRIGNTASIPIDIKPSSVKVNENQQVEIVWANDQHVSRFELSWLRTHCYSLPSPQFRWQPKLWGSELKEALPEAYYHEISTSDEALKNWLLMIKTYGVAILRGAPIKSGAIAEIVGLFGYVRESSWGRFFDIKFETNPNTVARTHHPLPSHTDEPFRHNIPSVQLIQCLVSNSVGGDSSVVDGFQLAAILLDQEPQMFKLLSTLSVHFYFEDEESCLTTEAPIIRLNELGEVASVRFSAHSTQPFQFPFEQMLPYYEAYQTFARMCQSPDYQVSFKLDAGDLYVVDNWRVLHGRTGFSETGQRHIQGCYSERDDIYSKLEVLSRNEPSLFNRLD